MVSIIVGFSSCAAGLVGGAVGGMSAYKNNEKRITSQKDDWVENWVEIKNPIQDLRQVDEVA